MATYENSNLIQGQDLNLFIDGKICAFGTSLSLDLQQDSIDTTSKFGGKWKASIPGKLSFTINSENLLTRVTGDTTFATLMASMVAQSAVAFTFSTVSGGTYTIGSITSGVTYFSGSAMINSLNLKSDNGDIAKFSISMTGVDALTITSA